jgi:signal transduction histidine kinase
MVTTTDNGVGLGNAQLRSGKSLGILGIKERARTLGGEADIYSPGGGGTIVEIKVPVKQYRSMGERA